MTTTDKLDDFRQKIEAAGLTAPHAFTPGGFVRFPGAGKASGNTNGWAWLSEDGQGGAFGDWTTQFSANWHVKEPASMTAAEQIAHKQRVARLQQIRKAEKAKGHAEAKGHAATIWAEATPADDSHPYLTTKHVKAHGLRLDAGNRLIVPVRVDGAITSLQFISPDGSKQFLAGGAVAGGYFVIGDLTGATIMVLVEGLATGASVGEGTGHPVIVAFQANNLLAVAMTLREHYPTAKIVIAADNDVRHDGTPNTGLDKATEAAKAIGGVLVIPELDGEKCDWNDVHVQRGLAAVRTMIDAALKSHPSPESLKSAMVDCQTLLTMKLPTRATYLPWFAEGSTAMIYAPRGVGKTYVVLGLMASLVTGQPFLKWNVSMPAGVLLLDGEMPLDDLRTRWLSLLQQADLKAPALFLTSEIVYQKLERDLVLTSSSVRDEVSAILDEHPEIKVLVLDNTSCLFAGLDENSKQEWEPIVAWLIQLRHRKISTILIHHAGKGGDQRGTSGREDMLDIVIRLTQPAGHVASDGLHFELRFTKARSIKGDAVAPLDVKLIEKDGQLLWEYQALDESIAHRANLLFVEGVTSPTDLAEELGVTKGYASKLIKKIKQGMST